MYNPDEDILQEIQSSDSDEDVSSPGRSRSQAHDIKELVSWVDFLLISTWVCGKVTSVILGGKC